MAVADALGEAVEYQETGQLVDNMNVDGGRSSKAATLEPEQLSERFLSSNGDGYYYVKLIEKTDTEVNYNSLKIAFTKFDTMLESLYTEGKVKPYINIELDEGGANDGMVEEEVEMEEEVIQQENTEGGE